MISSRASRSRSRSPRAARACLGIGTAALALALVLPAGAQTLGVLPVETFPADGAPVPDAPPSGGGMADQNVPTRIIPGSEPQSRIVQPRPGESGSSIEIGTLDGQGAPAAGPDVMPLNSGIWADTPRARIERNLPALPVATGSPVLNDLLRQVLLASPSAAETANGASSLLPQRLERLMAAGRPEWAARLAANSSVAPTPDILAWRARAELAAMDDAAACATLTRLPVDGDPASDPVAAFAIKLNVYCQISKGNKEAAIMTADLAREEGVVDPLFYSLAAQASDGITLKSENPASLDALYAAFYRKAGRAFPTNVIEIAEPALFASLSKDDNLPVEQRIAVGEYAARLGALSGNELAALYQLANFTEADFDGLKTASFPTHAAMRRALLYHAVKRETVPSQRIYLFKLAFATGQSAGLSTPLSQVLQPALAGMPLTADYKPLAPTAIRTFLLLGDRMNAARWYGLTGTQSAIFGRDARELSALMRISDASQMSGEMDRVSADIVSDLSSGIATSAEFARLETILLAGLGMHMEPTILAAVPEANEIARNAVPANPLLAELHAAAARRAVGETLMLSLVALGEGGAGSTSLRAIGEVVVALRAIGFENDARRLATEAMLARSNAGRG